MKKQTWFYVYSHHDLSTEDLEIVKYFFLILFYNKKHEQFV